MAHPTNKNIRKPWSPWPSLHLGFEALNHSFTFGTSPQRLLEPTCFLPPFPLETFNLNPARKPLLPRKQNAALFFLSAPPNSHQHREQGRTCPNLELSYNRFPLRNKQKPFASSYIAPSHQLPRPYTLNSCFSGHHRSTQLLLLQTTLHSLSLRLRSLCGDGGGGVWVAGGGCGWRNVEKVKSCSQIAEGYTSDFIDYFYGFESASLSKTLFFFLFSVNFERGWKWW